MWLCGICYTNNFSNPILTIKNSPLQVQNLSERSAGSEVELEVYQCEECKTVQLRHYRLVSYWDKAISSGMLSEENKKYRVEQLKKIKEKYGVKDSIFDIGRGLNKEVCESAGFKKYNYVDGFFEDPLEDNYDCFVILNYLEHVPEPGEFLSSITEVVSEEAVGIIEVPNFDMILKNKLYSEFMNEHIFYFTKETFSYLLKLHGWDVLEKSVIKDGYVLSFIVKKNKTVSLQEEFEQEKEKFIDSFKEKTKYTNTKVAVYGAGHQSFSFLSFLPEEEKNKIVCVIDDAPSKQGNHTPVTNIPIVSFEQFLTTPLHEVDYLVFIGGSYNQEMVNRLQKHWKDFSCVLLQIEKNELKRIK